MNLLTKLTHGYTIMLLQTSTTLSSMLWNKSVPQNMEFDCLTPIHQKSMLSNRPFECRSAVYSSRVWGSILSCCGVDILRAYSTGRPNKRKLTNVLEKFVAWSRRHIGANKMGAVLVADKSDEILWKRSIGRPLKHQRPKYNGKTKQHWSGDQLNQSRGSFLICLLPLVCLVCHLVE